MPNFISADQIERALVQKLQHLHGFDSLDCHTDDPEDLNDGSGRATGFSRAASPANSPSKTSPSRCRPAWRTRQIYRV